MLGMSQTALASAQVVCAKLLFVGHKWALLQSVYAVGFMCQMLALFLLVCTVVCVEEEVGIVALYTL